ncbi:MAG TPA: glycosyltransferase family A protein [Dongiaceae bacterium]|nr:glycosyltransferase family A protein [Dongiaceae bacterium]
MPDPIPTSLVVVIPVGPFCGEQYICDTIESIRHYTAPDHRIIILDDSGKETGAAIQKEFAGLDVLKTERNLGKHAGLYLNLSRGLIHASKKYAFQVLLRLDTDALIIGANPEQDAIACFKQHPGTGILGSYRTDCNGDSRDFSPPRNKLRKELGWKHLMQAPLHRFAGWYFLHQLYHRALRNGYEPGEHCMGGAYFMSRECVLRLWQGGLLSRPEIAQSGLEEDHIFGLLIHAVGLRHGDFATGNHPMGLRWRGLPCTPEELRLRGKKIIHSTRFFDQLSEPEIRNVFQAHRHGQ